jgi:hypothetical protein
VNSWYRSCLLVAVLISGTGLFGQGREQEFVRMGLIEITRPTEFKKAALSASRSWTVLRPPIRLRWIEGQQINGFLRAVGLYGPYGWVSLNDVRVLQSVPPLLAERAKTPCQINLAACDQTYTPNSPTRGCANAAHEPGAALANEHKHGPFSGGSIIDLSFSDFAMLQARAQALVGQGSIPTPAIRARLASFPVTNGTVSEGSTVHVPGFIATGPLGPHPNTGESVNCNLSAPADNDFHINITAVPGKQEFAGFVIEMIPQNRSAGWSLQKLESVRSSQRKILVIRSLFYDSFHVVNDKPQAPLSSQPRRFSLWEIHPIGYFFVCTRPTNDCNPSQPSDWVALDSFSP